MKIRICHAIVDDNEHVFGLFGPFPSISLFLNNIFYRVVMPNHGEKMN
jgi:hypothetical protein